MATATDVVNSTGNYIVAAQAAANAAISKLDLAAAGWTSVSWSPITAPTAGQYTLFTAETDAQIAAALTTLESAVTAGYGNFNESDSAIASALETLESAITGGYTQFAESDATIKTALAAFDATIQDINPGGLPLAPSIEGAAASPMWQDTHWQNLKEHLIVFMTNLGNDPNIDTLVTNLTSETTRHQVALYAADRERKQQALRDAFSAASSATGAKGFTHPNCMTTALRLGAQQQYMFDLSQVSRDLVAKVFDWAKNSYQFLIEKRISVQNSDVDFNIRYSDVLIKAYSEVQRNILDLYRARVATEMSKSEKKIKEYALRLDITKANAGIMESGDRVKLAKLEEKIKGFAQRLETVRVNAAIDESDDRMKMGKLEARLKSYAQRLEVIKTNASVTSDKDSIEANIFQTEVQQHAASVAKAVETAASNARNKIDAAVASVNAAANMVSSASQISIGVLNG